MATTVPSTDIVVSVEPLFGGPGRSRSLAF
jgi:hypothetical protein